MPRRVPIWLAAVTLACGPADHPLDTLRQPGGMALSPRGTTLFVTLGNWDARYDNAAVIGVDLVALEDSLRTNTRACVATAPGRPAVCDARALILPELGVRVPSGTVNIAVANHDAPRGSARLLIPSRLDPAMSWVDVVEDDAGPTLRCDQDAAGIRGRSFRIEGIADEPARITVDSQGHEFAYLPHLIEREADSCEDRDDLGCAGMTMFRLDGTRGPEIADTARNFRTDPVHQSGLRGGFAVAQFPCRSDNAPWLTDECRRPMLYATHRYWFGFRMFSVATGLDSVIGNQSVELPSANTQTLAPLPLMGDLAFEDESGERLLVVHTTPPTLARVDTSLDDEGRPVNAAVSSIALCANANLLKVDIERALAFVTCRSANELAVVDLRAFALIRTIPVDRGPNEMQLDAERSWLYVANDLGDSISVVELDATDPGYLSEVARIE